MPSPALFGQLKAYFLGAIAASSGWTCDGLTNLADILVLALQPVSRRRPLLSFGEGRAALRSASDAIRQKSLWYLHAHGRPQGASNNFITSFFRKAWPRERKFQTTETTRALLFLVKGLGSRFADGVRLVADFLTPLPEVDVHVYQFGNEGEHGHADLTKQFPHETLLLLDKVIDSTHQRSPYGLAEVLTRLSDAAPELRHDDRWQRLRRLSG
jgi:hypothetical protein